MFEVDLFPDVVEGEAAASPSPGAPWGCWCSRPVNILSDIWMNVSRCINIIYYVMHKFYLRVLFCAWCVCLMGRGDRWAAASRGVWIS
jgi:hypothetical protein